MNKSNFELDLNLKRGVYYGILIPQRLEGDIMPSKLITFNKLAKRDILELFDKTIDSEGYIVEKENPTQRVLSLDGEEIHIDKFAAITKGSEAFVASDLISLIHLSSKIKS